MHGLSLVFVGLNWNLSTNLEASLISTKSHPSLLPVACLFLAVCASNYLSLPANAALTYQSTDVWVGSRQSKSATDMKEQQKSFPVFS